MKKNYIIPECNLLSMTEEEIITDILSVSTGSNENYNSISWNELLEVN